jgi:hypothetical protein
MKERLLLSVDGDIINGYNMINPHCSGNEAQASVEFWPMRSSIAGSEDPTNLRFF